MDEPTIRVLSGPPRCRCDCPAHPTIGEVILMDAADAHLLDGRFLSIARRPKYTSYVRLRDHPKEGPRLDALLHRVIMDPPPGMVVDHINGNGLDNRRVNLRVCTPSENNLNRRQNRSSRWPYKGISRTPAGQWRAVIRINRRKIELGTFDSIVKAAKVYDAAAIKFHGEFAHLNFPD